MAPRDKKRSAAGEPGASKKDGLWFALRLRDQARRHMSNGADTLVP